MGFEPQEHFAEDRLNKRESLEDEGINLYPHEFNRTCVIREFVNKYEDVDEIETENKYKLAGRISGNIRDLGSIKFIDITDETGTVQLFFQEDDLDDYDILENIDRGDFIGVEGKPMRTNNGELSINVSNYDILTKSLSHPPGYEELSEEKKLRNRAVALRNNELQSNLRYRFNMISSIRRYLEDNGFIQVQTPILHNVAGGTSARPFTTKSNAKDSELHLRIAKELYHKRMVIGGFEKIFEIDKDFRNEDIDTTHNPEFTMMELYEAYADYHDMMDITEDIVVNILNDMNNGDYIVEYDKPVTDEGGEVKRNDDGEILTESVELDFEPPWPRLTMTEAIEEYADVDVTELNDEEIKSKALEVGGEFPGGFSRGLGIMEIFEGLVEHKIVGPLFIIDHPSETTPLCKDHRSKEGRIERFEVFAVGAELGNAYTELNDPIQQGEHFAKQVERKEEGDEEAHSMDQDFVNALSYGMPPTGGLGIGIDRLAMILTNSQSIKSVLPFPMVSDS